MKSESHSKRRNARRPVILLALALLVLAFAVRPDAVAAAWERVVRLLTISGEPVTAALPVLSDHEIEELRDADPQTQAEVLLGRAVTGFAGARELIEAEVDGWRGRIKLEGQLHAHHRLAMNAVDLRVRAAAIEVYLAAHGIEKTVAQADQLVLLAEENPQGRAWSLFTLGMLAHRGVESERIVAYLEPFVVDADENVRHWAVEGLAYSGMPEQIPILLEVFRRDESPRVQERAACSLAQSGMLPWAERWQAVPAFLDLADDPALSGQARRWVFQALSDITGERLGPDAEVWREWWSREGRTLRPRTAYTRY